MHRSPWFLANMGYPTTLAEMLVKLGIGPGNAYTQTYSTADRTVAAPTEAPLGVVTAIVGGPLFLWLLRRTRAEYGEWG